jgi:UDP-GlcNAc:undecaprenyl-phosphate GlcNAc-1-phosphate transferase
LTAATVAMLVAPVVIGCARRWGVLDRPQGYKAHAVPTPLLGGIMVAIASLAGALWLLPMRDVMGLAVLSALAIGAMLILIVGLVDDLRGMKPGHKLSWQLAATTATAGGLALIGDRLEPSLAWPPWPMIGLTVMWVVGLTNAFNFLDNMNGLCAGLGAIAALSLSILNWHFGEPALALASVALAGACLGFLPYNWPTARVFLGDTGSMFIGFLLAWLSVMSVYAHSAELPGVAMVAPLLVLTVPVLDALLVVMLRVRAGHVPWLGDRRHLNHRLVRRGMSQRGAVLVMWMAGAACGVAAVSLPLLAASAGLMLIGILALGLVALAVAAGAEGLS